VTVSRVLLLVLALLHATGFDEVVRRAICEEECRSDGCNNDCTPGDAPSCLCHCPSTPTATAPAIAVQAMPPASQATAIIFERTDPLLSSPDPREIWHVPRAHTV
jgi:hypothetical protein